MKVTAEIIEEAYAARLQAFEALVESEEQQDSIAKELEDFKPDSPRAAEVRARLAAMTPVLNNRKRELTRTTWAVDKIHLLASLN
jgi:hypothetical protein